MRQTDKDSGAAGETLVHMSVAVAMFLLFSAPAHAAGGDVVHRHAGGVEDRYIVLLANVHESVAGVRGLANSLSATYGLTVSQVWPYVLKSFSCIGPADAARRLADDPRVAYVEQDVRAAVPVEPSGTQYAFYDPFCGVDNPNPNHRPPYCDPANDPNNWYLWYLDRLDEPTWATRSGDYNMCPEGRDVYAYVIDYGVQKKHREFEWDGAQSRVVLQVNFTADTGAFACEDLPQPVPHGTGVAGALAGTHIGSSKARIVSLKVLPCSSNITDYQTLFSALDWIGSPNNPYVGQPAVISQSVFIAVWNNPPFDSYAQSVDRLVVATGIPFFKSADNFSGDSCQFSPSQHAYTNVTKTNRTVFVAGGTSVTACRPTDPGYPDQCPAVSSSDNNDYRWQKWNGDGTAQIGQDSGSNGGACVSIYAPANAIFLASNQLTNCVAGTNDLCEGNYWVASGTSFSAPLTAGMAARYISQQRALGYGTPGYQQVYEFLLGQATANILFEQTPDYYICGQPVSQGFQTQVSYSSFVCPAGWVGPIHMTSQTNSSNARVLYWNAGRCQ